MKTPESSKRKTFLTQLVGFLNQTRAPENFVREHAIIKANELIDSQGLTWPDLLQAEITEPCKFDFEALYLRYPRKIGKKLGIQRAKRLIKTADKYAQLQVAIENYRLYHDRKESDACYLLHFSTFMNRWEDYFDPSFLEELPPETPKTLDADTSPEKWDDFS